TVPGLKVAVSQAIANDFDFGAADPSSLARRECLELGPRRHWPRFRLRHVLLLRLGRRLWWPLAAGARIGAEHRRDTQRGHDHRRQVPGNTSTEVFAHALPAPSSRVQSIARKG